MTGYDLTEAIEAADIAIHQGADAPCHCADEDLTAALTAALPHLEQQIREQVAADIEAEAANYAEPNGINPQEDGEHIGLTIAARIARTRKDTDHA